MPIDTIEFARFVAWLVFGILAQSQQQPQHHDRHLPSMQQRQQSAVLAIHSILRGSSSVVSLPMVLTSLLYIHRVAKSRVSTPAHGAEAHLFFIALVAAHKVNDDSALRCRAWSKVTGLPPPTIVLMEREFLGSIGYELFVGKAEYRSWVARILGLAQTWDMHQRLAAARKSQMQQTQQMQQTHKESPVRITVTPESQSGSPCGSGSRLTPPPTPLSPVMPLPAPSSCALVPSHTSAVHGHTSLPSSDLARPSVSPASSVLLPPPPAHVQPTLPPPLQLSSRPVLPLPVRRPSQYSPPSSTALSLAPHAALLPIPMHPPIQPSLSTVRRTVSLDAFSLQASAAARKRTAEETAAPAAGLSSSMLLSTTSAFAHAFKSPLPMSPSEHALPDSAKRLRID
ncbi:hypothetical protein BC831DRAFT_476054 [Entophlyctis helioformis]|nr:hypothetical protein BC831DRAFT_476054 [Entophlyctis helioformis]